MDKQTPKIFKVSGYLLDPTGRLNADKIRSKLAYGCGYPFHTQHLHEKKRRLDCGKTSFYGGSCYCNSSLFDFHFYR